LKNNSLTISQTQSKPMLCCFIQLHEPVLNLTTLHVRCLPYQPITSLTLIEPDLTTTVNNINQLNCNFLTRMLYKNSY